VNADEHRHATAGHEHEHENGHGHGHDEANGHDGHVHPTGLKGVFGSVFAPRSHNAADSLDDALTSSDRGIRAVRVSFVALMCTAVLQLGVVIATSSVALLADTIHNFSDALTAIPLFLAFKLGRRAPNRRYTYGYGRAEDLAGLFVLAMITASAVVAAWEAIDRLLNPRAVKHVWVLLAAGLVGFVGNELVALYRIREGRAIGSAALVADGLHARTDGFTSLAVALGAVGVAAGFQWADPVIGLVISVAIFAVLVGAARQVYGRLMDAVDPGLVDEIEHQVGHVPGVAATSDVRVRWVGHRLTAELTIDVAADLSVRAGHDLSTRVHDRLLTRVAHLDSAVIHVHPVREPTPTS
jgi:cation diffusion facilitator family transporter